MYAKAYLEETKAICDRLDYQKIEDIVDIIKHTRAFGGRVFFCGVGGSAGTASHAVNDFRKLLNIESYSISDNVSELTARVNDDGWESSYSEWLKVSKASSSDLLFVLSVGGGSEEKNVSMNIVNAIKYFHHIGANVVSILGKKDGYAASNSNGCVIVPTESFDRITPHSEAFQSVILHLIVSHPYLQVNKTKW